MKRTCWLVLNWLKRKIIQSGNSLDVKLYIGSGEYKSRRFLLREESFSRGARTFPPNPAQS